MPNNDSYFKNIEWAFNAKEFKIIVDQYSFGDSHWWLVFSLEGCDACSALVDSLQARLVIEDKTQTFLSETPLLIYKIACPSDLEGLGLYPTEFPTLLALKGKQVRNGWVGFMHDFQSNVGLSLLGSYLDEFAALSEPLS
jgi:hypothetical protein